MPVVEMCGKGYNGWFWRNTSFVTVAEIRRMLANYEKGIQQSYPEKARIIPYLLEPDIGECYPDCDRLTDVRATEKQFMVSSN